MSKLSRRQILTSAAMFGLGGAALNFTKISKSLAAASMGAIAFQKGLGAMHALAHPIGALYNTHHGTTNAVVMPMVLNFNRPAIEASIKKAADYIGIAGGFDGFLAAIITMRKKLQIPNNLTELGVPQDQLTAIVNMAVIDPSASGNPIPLTHDNTMALLKSCF